MISQDKNVTGQAEVSGLKTERERQKKGIGIWDKGYAKDQDTIIIRRYLFRRKAGIPLKVKVVEFDHFNFRIILLAILHPTCPDRH
jgi:hypothetical protein